MLYECSNNFESASIVEYLYYPNSVPLTYKLTSCVVCDVTLATNKNDSVNKNLEPAGTLNVLV